MVVRVNDDKYAVLERQLQEQHNLHTLRANAEKIKDVELDRLRKENEKLLIYIHRIEEAARKHLARCGDAAWDLRAALEEEA